MEEQFNVEKPGSSRLVTVIKILVVVAFIALLVTLLALSVGNGP